MLPPLLSRQTEILCMCLLLLVGWGLLTARHFTGRSAQKRKLLKIHLPFHKRLLSELPLYLLWGVFSVLFPIFLFGQLRFVPKEKKLLLYLDVPSIQEEALENALYRNLPEPARAQILRIEAHAFSYVLFQDESVLLEGDLYLLSEETLSEFSPHLAPLASVSGSEALMELLPADERDFSALWIRIPSSLLYEATDLPFPLSLEPNAYYLAFGKASSHLSDGHAAAAANAFFSFLAKD